MERAHPAGPTRILSPPPLCDRCVRTREKRKERERQREGAYIWALGPDDRRSPWHAGPATKITRGVACTAVLTSCRSHTERERETAHGVSSNRTHHHHRRRRRRRSHNCYTTHISLYIPILTHYRIYYVILLSITLSSSSSRLLVVRDSSLSLSLVFFILHRPYRRFLVVVVVILRHCRRRRRFGRARMRAATSPRHDTPLGYRLSPPRWLRESAHVHT